MPRVHVSVLALVAILLLVSGSGLVQTLTPAEAAPRSSNAGAAATMISSYRAAYGLGRVVVDPRLNAAAEYQARVVAALGSLSHGDFAGRMAAFGIRGKAAENLGIGVASVDQAIAQWRASSAHNANLLMPEATRIGIAHADAGYRRYWALVLAR